MLAKVMECTCANSPSALFKRQTVMTILGLIVVCLFICALRKGEESKGFSLHRLLRSSNRGNRPLWTSDPLTSSAYPCTGLPPPMTRALVDLARRRNETHCHRSSNITSNEYHPNLVHVIRFYANGDSTLDTLHFLSLLSAERQLSPRGVFFYSNVEPSGPLWQCLKQVVACLRWVHLKRMKRIGGLRPGKIQHEADYNKVRIIGEHGGLFIDLDVIVTNATRLRHLQQGHECVLSCVVARNRTRLLPLVLSGQAPCPRLNAGFISCRAHSPFMRLWLQSYSDYNPHVFTYNSGLVPARIFGEYNNVSGDSLVLDKEVSIHPMWDEKRQWMSRGDGIRWRLKSAAHHFWKMHELDVEDFDVLSMNNSFGDMLRDVVRCDDARRCAPCEYEY